MQTPILNFEVGQTYVGFFYVKSVEVRQNKLNKPYLDFTLSDATSEINGKLWEVSDKEVDLYHSGDIIAVKMEITSWQDQKQAKILMLRPSNSEDEIDMGSIVPIAPIDPKQMYDEIYSIAESLTNQELRAMSISVLEEYKEKLMIYPAAKSNHHSFRSGLLYHLLRMIRVARALCDIYSANFELLYTGIVFHDMQKITEMNISPIGLVTEYSKEGTLIGHIVEGIVDVDKRAEKLGVSDEVKLLIKHMVLSHHGEPEYGSPIKPLFLEAQLLHFIDNIDATVFDFQRATENIEKGTFSNKIFSLDKRSVYLPNL